MMKAMWDAHMYATREAKVAANIQSTLAKKSMCLVMDRERANISDTILADEVYAWRGGRKAHMFFHFLFVVGDDMPAKVEILSANRLNQIFVALKDIEKMVLSIFAHL